MRSDTNVQSQLVGRNYCSNGSWHCFASYWPCPASPVQGKMLDSVQVVQPIPGRCKTRTMDCVLDYTVKPELQTVYWTLHYFIIKFLIHFSSVHHAVSSLFECAVAHTMCVLISCTVLTFQGQQRLTQHTLKRQQFRPSQVTQLESMHSKMLSQQFLSGLDRGLDTVSACYSTVH